MMRKKLITIFLAIAMMVTFLPSMTFASSIKTLAVKPLKVKITVKDKNTVKLTWNKVSKAKKYVVYAKTSGKQVKMATVKSNKNRTYTVKKIKGKKIKNLKNFKLDVRAYNSKNKLIVKSSAATVTITKDGPKVKPGKNNTAVSLIEEPSEDPAEEQKEEEKEEQKEEPKEEQGGGGGGSGGGGGGTTPTSTYVNLGGRIFYAADNITGQYKFYDVNQKEITNWQGANGTQTVSNLANACYYKVVSASTTGEDEFYVFATATGRPDEGVYVVDDLTWGEEIEIGIGDDYPNAKLGKGKLNSNIALNASSCMGDKTVWYWIKNFANSGKGLNNCNDWYIGSKNEYNVMDETNLAKMTGFSVDIFDAGNVGAGGKNIWCSIEQGVYNAYRWRLFNSWWGAQQKTSTSSALPIRSF